MTQYATGLGTRKARLASDFLVDLASRMGNTTEPGVVKIERSLWQIECHNSR